jgi:hypothetical protein
MIFEFFLKYIFGGEAACLVSVWNFGFGMEFWFRYGILVSVWYMEFWFRYGIWNFDFGMVYGILISVWFGGEAACLISVWQGF